MTANKNALFITWLALLLTMLIIEVRLHGYELIDSLERGHKVTLDAYKVLKSEPLENHDILIQK